MNAPNLVDEVGLEPTMPEAGDLQSPGVTNFPTHPNLFSFLSPLYLKTNQLSTSYLVLKYRIELSTNPYHGFVIPLNYKSTGTPTLIRTERTTPFERVDFTNLSMGAY